MGKVSVVMHDDDDGDDDDDDDNVDDYDGDGDAAATDADNYIQNHHNPNYNDIDNGAIGTTLYNYEI